MKNRNIAFLFQLFWQPTPLFLETTHLFAFVGSVNSKEAETIALFYFVCWKTFFNKKHVLKIEKEFFGFSLPHEKKL